MAVASLTRFTVPVATDQSASAQGLLMPKLQYRFRVLFENFGVSKPTTELTKQVMDITRPTVDFDDITLDVYNSKVRMAGRHTWQDVTVQLRDDAAGSVSRLVGEQLQRQFDFFEQSSAVSSGSYKFQTSIEILDGGNGANGANIIDRFRLVGCYIESANYNTLAYATNEAVTTTLTIRYDNAIQFGADESFTGIGEATARAVAASIGGTTVTG